ncbi:transmembrane protein 179B [Polypterus senegalus]|uniref:transmembrane protein 179B n=1 Tax=Polypterus senegalus TaxID=55291 RepID=UPI001965F018|nr:transmembrane protein 179B [Polypterus senegalus]
MALPWWFVAELLLYTVTFVCGIITASSVTITQGHFNGRCMLYGSVKFNSTSEEFTVESSQNVSLCYFVSAISIFIAIYCFSIVLYWIYSSCMDEVKRGKRWLMISLVIGAAALFFLLISGCVLNVGLKTLCDSVLKDPKLKSCQEAEAKKWSNPYQGSQFYTSLHNAEVAAWVNFFLWVTTMVLLVIQKKKGSEFTPLSASDPEWSTSETDPIFHRSTRSK